MIFTVIGIALRCLAVAAWGSVESLQGFCNVLFVVYIILCILGLIKTYLRRHEKTTTVTIITFIVQIAASVYFTFAANSLVGKIIGGIAGALILGFIISLFPDSPEKPESKDGSQGALDLWDNMCEENLRNVQAQQEDYYSRLREINYAKRYGESGELHTSNGDKIELNDDGTMFKDKDGNWHYV